MSIFLCHTKFKYEYDSLEDSLKAKVFDRIETLESLPAKDWRRPGFDSVKDCHGLKEIRIQYNNMQYRVLGFFGTDKGQFTMLHGFIKQGDSDMKNGCNLALKRMKKVKNGQDDAINW